MFSYSYTHLSLNRGYVERRCMSVSKPLVIPIYKNKKKELNQNGYFFVQWVHVCFERYCGM